MVPPVNPLSHYPSISQSPGSHCCILTRSWSRRSLCLALSEVRVPRIYCSGGRRPLTSGHPLVTVLLAVIDLGHSSLLLHTSLAVTDPLFSPGPLTVPARHCPHKHPLPRVSLPQLLQAPVPSDSFPAPRHRLAKSNRLRGDARETSDRDCGPEVPPPARPLVNSTSAFLKTTTCHSRSASSRARRSE